MACGGRKHAPLVTGTINATGKAPSYSLCRREQGRAAMDVSFDFEELIAAASKDTLPRPQIESELRYWLNSAPSGLLVLRGETGFGKTCLMARQIQQLGGLHHFLRFAHTQHSLWRDPYGFLTSI